MTMLIGIVSDTHGVFDQDVCDLFSRKGVELILHAGDVGHHGGHQGVLSLLKKCAPVIAVRGNVDDIEEDCEDLPSVKALTIIGWRILLIHIVKKASSQEWRQTLQEYHPDIILHGHSHVYSVGNAEGIMYINPGSAGPARFKLKRTAAILDLPHKASGKNPVIERLQLAKKAPKRIAAATQIGPVK